MNRISKEVGLRLKQLRESLGLSQAKLAKTLRVSQSAISKWESGERDIPTSVLAKLKELFNVNLDWLLTGKGKMFSVEDDISAVLTPELVEFFKNYPPEVQKKFVEFFKDSLEFLSKYSQTSSSPKSDKLLKNKS